MYGIKDYTPPVAGKFRVTGNEGLRKVRRTAGGKMMSSFQHGVDIAGATPGSKPVIRNITNGHVVWAGNTDNWGNTVVVQNSDGYAVQYGHLDSISVKAGDQVSAGDKIGIMGATGNVTGNRLNMVVTKNGKSIHRDGSVLADAPEDIARRASGRQHDNKQVSESMPATPAVADYAAEFVTEEQSYNPTGDLFSSTPTVLLKGSVGLAVPETKTENKLFAEIADMGLSGGLEIIYAEAARAIAGVKDSIESRPMLQSTNPLRAELSSIFDRIEV